MYEEREKEESIYNLIPKTCTLKEKKRRHMSKFRRLVLEELTRNRAPCKTLGPFKVQTRPPDRFLKKHEREPRVPEKRIFKYPDAEHKKPPVPKPDERPVMGLRTTKNLITTNALENIHSVPKVPARNVVDTRHGDKMVLLPSGLEPRFLHKKDYGRNPDYLDRRREDTKKAQDEYDAYVAEHFRKGSMRRLSAEEREALLEGLKDNWEQVQHDFLMLSVTVDTPGKMTHKEKMELELKQLEKDVELLETHKTIYVAN